MHSATYQREALRSSIKGELGNDLVVCGLGLTGEAGEVADHIKKIVFHGHDMDKAKLTEELGDVLWYITFLCATLDVKLGDVMQQNIDKLWRRYPQGFSEEASRNRTA